MERDDDRWKKPMVPTLENIVLNKLASARLGRDDLARLTEVTRHRVQEHQFFMQFFRSIVDHCRMLGTSHVLEPVAYEASPAGGVTSSRESSMQSLQTHLQNLVKLKDYADSRPTARVLAAPGKLLAVMLHEVAARITDIERFGP